jgi:hypothetical protein
MTLLLLSFLAIDLEFKIIRSTSMYSQEYSTLALGKDLGFSKSPTIGWPWMAWMTLGLEKLDFPFFNFGKCNSIVSREIYHTSVAYYNFYNSIRFFDLGIFIQF